MVKQIPQSEVKSGDTIWSNGYPWIVDKIAEHDDCYRFTCHWRGDGPDPKWFNNDYTTGFRKDLTIAVER